MALSDIKMNCVTCYPTRHIPENDFAKRQHLNSTILAIRNSYEVMSCTQIPPVSHAISNTTGMLHPPHLLPCLLYNATSDLPCKHLDR